METAVIARETPAVKQSGTQCAVVAMSAPYGFWPVVKMSDGTYRKGPFAEIVGRWSDG